MSSTRRPTSSRSICPRPPETEHWLDAEAFAKMRDGVRILNVARGRLIDDAALKAALDSGKVGGAALDVFPSEPITDYPLFSGYPKVVVTPHLGASTAEATDRAGFQSAEQVVAALTGGVVSTAVNIPADRRGGHGGAGRSCRSPGSSAGSRWGWPRAVRRAHRGGVHGPDRRSRHAPADDRGRCGALGRTEEQVNYVNAPSLAEERGIVIEERVGLRGPGFNELIRVRSSPALSGSVSPAPASARASSAPGRGLGPTFDSRARPNVSVFRYADLPGMIGRVGTIFGDMGSTFTPLRSDARLMA